jgi:hypothetical protein
MDAVMSPRGCSRGERVEHPHGESGCHPLLDLGHGHPPDGLRLVRRSGRAGDGVAAEHQRDDTEGQVLVDAGEPLDLDDDPGLLDDLAPDAVLEGLVELQDAAGRLPPRVVAALDHEHRAVVADGYPDNGNGVPASVTHGVVLSCK